MNIPDICPRCKTDWIPNNDQPAAHIGALSRVDDQIEICSACGEDEALKDYFDGGCEPVTAWPVKRKYTISFQTIDGGGKE